MRVCREGYALKRNMRLVRGRAESGFLQVQRKKQLFAENLHAFTVVRRKKWVIVVT